MTATARRVAATVPPLLLLLLALVAPASAAPSPGPGTAPSAESSAASDGMPVRVQITAVTPQVLRPGEDLVVRTRLTNTTDEPVADPRVRVRIERIRPGDRDGLDTWLSEPDTGDRIGSRVATITPDQPLAPGASVELEAVVPAADVGLLDRPDTWGARGLAVEVVDGRSRVGLQRSFVLWATDDDVAQARVSLLAPVVGTAVAPDGSDVDPPGPTLPELVRPGGRLADVLQLVQDHPDVALAVDPALLAQALEGNGVVAQWREQLVAAAVGRDVVTLPWEDPDLTALAHAGTPALLEAAVTTSRAATERDGALRGRTDVLWAPGPATDQATADLAASVGATTLVLAPDDLPTDDDAGSRTAVTTSSGPVTGLVPDDILTTLVSSPTDLDPDATTATVVQRVLAELSVLARSSTDGPQQVLVVLPRGTDPDVALVDAVLAAVESSPWSRTAPLTALLGSTPPKDRDTLPALVADEDAMSPTQLRTLADAYTETVAFAGITDDPAALLAGAAETTLAPVSVAWRADPEGRSRVVEEVVGDLTARRTGLTLAPASTQSVISATSEVRFSVRNELSVGASVRVETRPRKGCVSTEPSPTVLVGPGSEEVVPVTLHAIANCEVVVEARLTSEDGTVLAPPTTFVVRASPTIESVGTAVVGVLLAVGLVLGVIRTVRRGQSARRGARRVDEHEATRPLPVLGGSPDGDA